MSQKEYIYVWDLFVRFFHWSLVLLVIIAFVSGEETNLIHNYSGYLVFILLVLRFIWGFIGSKHALFKNFISSPAQAIQYLKEIIQGSPKYYIGHNPAAGWMVIFLLITLALVCATGHMAYKFDGQDEVSVQNFTITKYAHADSDDDDSEHNRNESEENEFWEDIHEGISFLLLMFIFFHISGALISSKLHNENLVKAMITGKKEKKA